jgi:hypothetical protein
LSAGLFLHYTGMKPLFVCLLLLLLLTNCRRPATVTRPGAPYVSRPQLLEIECRDGIGSIKPFAVQSKNGNVTTTLTGAGNTLHVGTASDDCTLTLTAARREWEREHSKTEAERVVMHLIPQSIWWVIAILTLLNIAQYLIIRKYLKRRKL